MPLEGVEQRLVARRHGREELAGPVRGGHEVDPQVLRQAAQQGGHQLLAQPGDVPGEVVGRDPVEGRDGHVDGEAVVGRPRLEVVADVEGQAGLTGGVPPPRGREVRLPDGIGRVVGEHRGVEGEQLGTGPALALPPGVEVGAADDLGTDAGVVEVEEGVLVDDDAAAAGPVLQLLGLGEQLQVLVVEAVPGRPLAVDQRVPDEQLAGELAVHGAVGDEPVGDERHAVQGDLLVGHHRGPLLGPVRLGVGPLHQVRADPLGPLGLDRGVLPRPQPRGLDQLAGHQELRVLPLQPAAGEDREPRTAGAEVLPHRPPLPRSRRLALVERADVREQARRAGPGGCRRRPGWSAGFPVSTRISWHTWRSWDS